MTRRWMSLIAFAVLASGSSLFSYAVADNSAASFIQSEIPKARLAGQGSFRWFGLKIYDAQLWVGDNGYQAAAPDAAKFALDLRYARSLVGRKIAESSRDQMEKIGAGSPQQLATWLEKMLKIFPDVQAGTHITGVYLPNTGARFYLNGTLLGEIMDAEFARAFFAIWLDQKSTAPALRDALLKNAAPG